MRAQQAKTTILTDLKNIKRNIQISAKCKNNLESVSNL